MSEQTPERRRLSSAHVISLVALFIALGSGAVAAVDRLGANSVGPKQIKPGAVGSSEIAKGAAGASDLQNGSIKGDKIAKGGVKREAIEDGAVDAAKIAKGGVRSDAIEDGAITSAKIARGGVKREAIEDGAIGTAALAPDAKTTLYTDVADGPINVAVSAPNVVVATLNLPAGSYLVTATSSAVHNAAGTSTRLECSILAPGPVVVDGSKERLAANTGPEPLIFAKTTFAGPVTLANQGTVSYDCVSTANTSIDLTSVRLMALRVTDIVAQ